MKMTLQVVIEDDDTAPQAVAQKVISLGMRQIDLTVLCLYKVNTVKQNRSLLTHALERNIEGFCAETLGLTLDEGKEILTGVQAVLVALRRHAS